MRRAERRQFRRVGTALSGFLSHDNRWDPCDILDVSANGARIRAAARVFDRDITLGLERFGLVRAKVVWRDRNLLGLQFVDAPSRVAQLMAGFLPKHCLAP